MTGVVGETTIRKKPVLTCLPVVCAYAGVVAVISFYLVIGKATAEARTEKEIMFSSVSSLSASSSPVAHVAQTKSVENKVDDTIDRVVVIGNKRVEMETIRSYLSLREGYPFDTGRIDSSLKSLFATGLFSDVSIQKQGRQLLVSVVENPVINSVNFEGNQRIQSDLLAQEVRLRSREIYTRTKVQNDTQRLIELYRRRGRFSVIVEPKVVRKEQNRVDLTFVINEGPPTYIQRINFIGNHQYGDNTLRDVLSSKEERWYRFLSATDTYDPDRFSYDRELLRRFYLQHGFIDLRIASAVAELATDREGFFITFSIEEGERYRYGDINVRTRLHALHELKLLEFVIGSTGDWYNAEELEESVQKLVDAAGSLGYAFVTVQPHLERNKEKHTVNVVYDIQEGPRVFVERIDIDGNVRTLDKVIRREIRLAEGDAFDTYKIQRSQRRIEDLDFFNKVEINSLPLEQSTDRTLVKVTVEEKSTGDLSFGAGWSTSAGAMMEVGLRERNLLGHGQDLRAAFTLGQRRIQADFSFTEPYFLDRDLMAGVDLFAVQRNLQRESSYDSSTTGSIMRLGFSYNELIRQSLNYTVKRDKVENVKISASSIIKQQEGIYVQSSVGQTFTYDTRDSHIHPTEGHVVRLGNEIAGLGGTDKFLRVNLGIAQYFSIDDQWILKLSTDSGYIMGLGKDIRIGQNYFLGGDNLRGFASAGVGPRDRRTKDALGSNWLINGSVEMSFPLGLPQELGVGGKIFSDFGTLGHFTDLMSPEQIYDVVSLRVSLGTGVVWKSPVGPLSIDLGIPIRKETFDQTELFRFNFGTRF